MRRELKVRVIVAHYVTGETWSGEKGLGMQGLESLIKDIGLYSENPEESLMGFMQENTLV